MPTTLPTKTADDLGTPLTNARAPRTNELSAVNLERIKDHIIALATELGLRNGSTPNSVWAALAAAAQALHHTLDATRAPTSGDDESAGYSTGSLWMWPTESRVWVYLVVPGLGADWLELQTAIEPADVLHDALGEPTVDGDLVRAGGSYTVRRAVVGAIVPPTATDDETQGFAIGSTWHDSAAGALYVCLDASTAAAVWARIDGGPVAPIEEPGTTRTLTAADHGQTIRCTHASGCAITVPGTLPLGFRCAVRQSSSSPVTFAGWVNPDAGFLAETAGLRATAIVEIDAGSVEGNSGVVYGSLAEAP